MQYARLQKKVITAYFAFFYYTIFAFFFMDHALLSQVNPILFHYNRDLSELALIAAGVPQYMVRHPGSFRVADILLYALPLFQLFYYFRKGKFSRVLGILFSLFLALYLLLLNIFVQVHMEPYTIYLLLSLAFLTSSEEGLQGVLAFCRYYFLYIFFSAAVWKLARGALFNMEEMSNILLLQHHDLLSQDCSSLNCNTYRTLIAHPALSYTLYLAGWLLEAFFAVGFFTRKFDRWLIFFAFLFFVADELVMRIAYWPILVGVIPLLLPPRASSTPKQPVP